MQSEREREGCNEYGNLGRAGCRLGEFLSGDLTNRW